MKIIEVRPSKKFKSAWVAFEAPGVEPAFAAPDAKRKAIDYACGRFGGSAGEVHIYGDDALTSNAASSSTVALTQHTALVGRSSQSRDIHPEIALDGDTGVSRRHAQLVRDGDGLVVIDLSSTNGTYVVPAGSGPTDDTDPVGAWSRLTVRLG